MIAKSPIIALNNKYNGKVRANKRIRRCSYMDTARETRPYVPWGLMEEFLVAAFVGYGVPQDDARICADVLHAL